ncbi:nicotinate-nucleotide pyrophosphorylase [carboxylating] [Filomicrobium insigne]|uniref:nicotinate-nucleotide diphosphorylase (carboxylating) n=1 Tax=Filomicrobium insigne TaxID=418854 RepID=A0A1H0M2C5_9HYPH|nr:carboxylating nicotinate-nucleotide diphosphorylase [Filomicrobium insigne]SDO74514.1 nicotinate-nucleotide pyrophosphorylase [carboxylating] [Filomicrobium insigne]
MTTPGPLPHQTIAQAVDAALAEDLGLLGDITSIATIAPSAQAAAWIATRQPGVISGISLAEYAFRALDPEIDFRIEADDGDSVFPGTPIAHVSGNARAILGAERVALNYLGRLSGIATLTRDYVDAIEGTSATIVDTRKTTPGLRALEKFAVRCGGGQNHRFGLFDAILIKDNHIVAAGGLSAAIERARTTAGHMVKIEVEVDTLQQLREAITHRIDAVLLDNMPPAILREAVAITHGRVLLEASGGVNLTTVRAIAETGVDLISVGALTHSAPVLDLGLDMGYSDA